MAKQKISEMTAAGPLTGTELFEVSQESGPGRVTRNTSLDTIKAWFGLPKYKAVQATINDDAVLQVDTGSAKPTKMSVFYAGNLVDALVQSTDGGAAATSVALASQVGTDLEAGANGAHTGTTGTDGKMTVAADDAAGVDGRFYVENRTGAAQEVTVLLWYL